MKKHLALILTILSISACDQLGSTRIKNLIDLTPPLEVEVASEPKFRTGLADVMSSKKNETSAFTKSNIISEPAIIGNVLYSSDQRGFVSAFSLVNNKELWRTDIKGPLANKSFIGGGILLNGNKLYITNGTRFLVILDATTGIEDFRKEFSDIIRTKPVIDSHSNLIIQTVANKVYSLNKESYKINWSHEGGIQTISNTTHVHPFTFQDSVIVSYTSGDIYALNLSNGAPKWRYKLTNQDNVTLPGFVPSTVNTQHIVVDDYSYFATSNGKLVKLYLYNGMPAWTKEAYDIQTIALHEMTLIVTNNARQIATIDANSGKVTWVGHAISQEERAKKKPKPVRFIEPFITISGGTYTINVAANNGELYSFKPDNTGKLPIWPEIKIIDKGIKYQSLSCCNSIKLMTDKKIISY